MNANASTITGVVYASGATVFGAEVKVEKIISNENFRFRAKTEFPYKSKIITIDPKTNDFWVLNCNWHDWFSDLNSEDIQWTKPTEKDIQLFNLMSDKYQVSSETLKKEVEEALTSAEQAEEESPEKEKLKAHALKLHDEYKQRISSILKKKNIREERLNRKSRKEVSKFVLEEVGLFD